MTDLIGEDESQGEVLVDPRLPRHDIIAVVKTFCADIIQEGNGWTEDDARYVASMLNRDEMDDPWGLFQLMDERTGSSMVGYKTSDGREWFPILRQMRNKRECGLFDYLRKRSA